MAREKVSIFKTVNIPVQLYSRILKIKVEIEKKLGYSIKLYSVIQRGIELLEKRLMEDK